MADKYLKTKTQVKLYNCYWCRCTYCINSQECWDHCTRCWQINNRDLSQRKFKMPEYCENFIENHSSNMRIKDRLYECDHCKYKRELIRLKENIDKLLKY